MSVLLERLADRGQLDPEELRAAQAEADTPAGPLLEPLRELSRRLPAGLVYAEGLWVLADPPTGLTPLGPESPWFAHERSLAVVIPQRDEALVQLLLDLAAYAETGARLRELLAEHQGLLTALAAPDWEPAAATELALLTGDAPAQLAALDQDAPGLRAEILRLAQHTFSAKIWIHADLRPRQGTLLGQEIAEALASATFGPALLVVSDTPLLVEHLSPYVRDLGHALSAWALENRDRLQTPGLAELLEGPLDDDLAALIAAELLETAPELLEERREAEASQGLVLADRQGTTYGHADLGQLAAPDPVVAEAGGRIVWLLAGGAERTLHTAVRALLETRRVTHLLFVGEARYDGRSPLVAEALSTDEDAVRLNGTGELVERAKRLGIEIELAPDLEARIGQGVWPVAAAILGLFRRAQVKQLVPTEAVAHACFYPRPIGPLERSKIALVATRLGLAALLAGESQKKTPTKTPGSAGTSRFVRRFRA